MRIDVITLFPELVETVVAHSIPKRAVEAGALSVTCWNPRDYTQDKHRTVDDRPYGGGPGMLMKVQPLRDAVIAAKAAMPGSVKVVYFSPQGRVFNQKTALDWAGSDRMIFIAGRYEGVDERFIDHYVDEEWSVGDYVLSGGELPAMVAIDAVARLLPGVLGHQDSAAEDSFSEGLLDCPHYTRPEVFEDVPVPPVLLGGNHAEIKKWRREQSIVRTWMRRPELLNHIRLSSEEQHFLNDFKTSYSRHREND